METLPVASAVEQAKTGSVAGLTTRDKHTRDCYVVAAEELGVVRLVRARSSTSRLRTCPLGARELRASFL
ncbi:hypothetical protein [Actinomyces respiraculi]